MTKKENERAEKLYAFIRSECAKTPVKNLTGLAAELGVKYHTLHYRLTTGTISALMMNNIIRVLNMDDISVRRLHRI